MLAELKAKTLELRKARNALGAVLQFHLSEIAAAAKAEQREATDEDALKYLKSATAKLKANDHANPDELALLETFLPQMASDDEILAVIAPFKGDPKGKGKAMGAAKKAFGLEVDMRRVGELFDA